MSPVLFVDFSRIVKFAAQLLSDNTLDHDH
jgi:hypothetical protein